MIQILINRKKEDKSKDLRKSAREIKNLLSASFAARKNAYKCAEEAVNILQRFCVEESTIDVAKSADIAGR